MISVYCENRTEHTNAPSAGSDVLLTAPAAGTRAVQSLQAWHRGPCLVRRATGSSTLPAPSRGLKTLLKYFETCDKGSSFLREFGYTQKETTSRRKSRCLLYFSPLKHSGSPMLLSTRVFMFRVVLTINSNCFPKQH
jgi:hypothetical protein